MLLVEISGIKKLGKVEKRMISYIDNCQLFVSRHAILFAVYYPVSVLELHAMHFILIDFRQVFLLVFERVVANIVLVFTFITDHLYTLHSRLRV